MAWTATMQQLARARTADPGPGLVVGDRTWTWSEVVDASASRAAWFDHVRGARPPHVGLLLPNGAEFALQLVAAALSGNVVVGLNTTRRGEELARDVRHADCQVVLVDPTTAPLVEGLDLGSARGHAIDVTSVEYAAELADHAGSRRQWPDVDPSSLFMLIFTSGTTGAPKAVRCSQGKIATQGTGLAERLGLTATDVSYLSMPLFHSNAVIAGFTPTLAAGATAVVAERFSASGFMRDVRAHGATYANYVGRPLSYVLAQPPRDDDRDSPLRVVFGNEAPPHAIEAFAERFGCRVVDGFGSTEGGLSVSRTPDTPPGSIGRVVGDVRIVHTETGRECPPARFEADGHLANAAEAIGELVNFDGIGSFEGYYGNERETAARTRGGRYHSGDLAYRDVDGFVFHAGRTGGWLRVDGENLATAPIERIMSRHPEVVAAAAYAVPDPEVGDQLMVALQPSDRVVWDPVDFAAWLDDQPDLSPKARPRFVRVGPVPMTATNKVLVRALAAQGLDTDAPVWWARRGEPYRLLTEEERGRLSSGSRRPVRPVSVS